MKIYDAENQILGRLCSVIAKQLLNGEKVIVVNVDKTVLAGNPDYILNSFLQKIHRGDTTHGPYYPKTPDGIFRRTVRGMLPWKKPKGMKAFKNLRVFMGIPDELKNKMDDFEQIKAADADKIKSRHMLLGKLAVAIGAKKRW